MSHRVVLYRVNYGDAYECRLHDSEDEFDSVCISDGYNAADAFAGARAFVVRLSALIDQAEAKEAKRAKRHAAKVKS